MAVTVALSHRSEPGVENFSRHNSAINVVNQPRRIAPNLMKKNFLPVRTAVLTAIAFVQFAFGSAAVAQTTVSLSVTDAVVGETWPGQSPNPANIRVSRTGSTAGALTVWVKLSGTAVRGADYSFGVAVGTFVSIPAGSAHLDISVNPIDDLAVEVTETVRFELDDETASGTPTPYSLGNDKVTVNLLDNDSLPPPALVSVESWEDGSEGYDGEAPTPGSIRIARSGNTAAALTVSYSVEGIATPGDDYAALSGSVVIPAGATFADVVVTPVDDDELEISEWVTLTILPSPSTGAFPPPASAYAFGDSVSADVTIYDNEIPPTRAVVDVAAVNGASENTGGAPVAGAFRFTRSANMDVAVTVAYSVGGSATEGTDYAGLSGSVTIPAGVEFVNVVVTPVDDAALDAGETVALTIVPSDCPEPFPPAECYVVGASGSASLTISDNEIAPTVTLIATQNPAVFGQPGAGIGALTASSATGYIASYEVRVDGAVRLTSGTGYPTPLAAGTVLQINIPIPNVTIGSHTVQVTVTDNQGFTATATSPLVIAFIVPTYSKMSVTAVDAEMAEGGANTATFRITVDAPMPTNQYVVYRLASPGPGVDFGYPAGYSNGNWPMFWPVGPTDYGYAYFPAGTTSVDVVVAAVDDAINEGTETLTLSLSYPFVFNSFFDERAFEGIVQFTEGGFYTPPYDPYALPVRYFDYDIVQPNVATAVILDNDTEPTPFAFVSITTTDADAAETDPGAPPNVGTFTVSRVGPTDLPLSVNYQLTARPRDIPLRFPIPVQAQSGVDFAALPTVGSVVIPAGATSVPIVISPIQDSTVETSEYVQINLQPSYYAVPSPLSYLLYGGTVASLVIRDLAPSAFTPVVRIKASDGMAFEAGATQRTGAFLVERIGSTTTSLTVPYTIGGTATNGVDFAPPLTGTVTIPAGALNAPIVIDPVADGITEPIEIVVLTLQSPPPDVSPVPYVISAAGYNSNTAGVSIRDVPPPGYGLSPRQLIVARRLGRLHPIVPVPVPAVPPPAGAPPINWAVEASSDLVVWEEIGKTTDPDEFVDVTAGDAEQRFYRFRQVAP